MVENETIRLPAVTLDECPPRGRINLRGNGQDPPFAKAVSVNLGLELPVEANTTRMGNGTAILWLGPDEWLIETDTESDSAIMGALETALSDQHVAVTLVSDSSLTYRLAGPRAVDVLAKGMTIDLDPTVFGAGVCARSLLARSAVLVHRPVIEDVYEITVARSFSDYVGRWLRDAMLEYS